MLDIDQIKNHYPSPLHRFDRDITREYLQYLILSLIFQHPFSSRLSFLGGSCLRIVHNLPRFSEDLDFDNDQMTEREFKKISIFLKRKLEIYGYEVEIRFISRAAFHCYIKFPLLLYQSGITTQKNQKLLIRLDTFDQGVNYKTQQYFINKFEFFKQIRVTPKGVLLSQKLWTITQRSRLQGRDFYDILFLLKTTTPQLFFLQQKFELNDSQAIFSSIYEAIHDADFDALKNDLQPFLFDPSEAQNLLHFASIFKQHFLS